MVDNEETQDQRTGVPAADDPAAADPLAAMSWPASESLAGEEAAGDDSDAPVELGDPDGTPAGDRGAHINADHVTLSQGGADTISAQTVSIHQGGAGKVRAEQVSVSQGGIALARTGSLTVEAGGSAFAVLADEARVEDGANVMLVVGRSVSGRSAVDWRAALAFGIGLGLVLIVVRRLVG